MKNSSFGHKKWLVIVVAVVAFLVVASMFRFGGKGLREGESGSVPMGCGGAPPAEQADGTKPSARKTKLGTKKSALLSSKSLRSLMSWVNTSKDSFQLRAKHSNKCLEVPKSSIQPKLQIHQYVCHDGENQQWYVTYRKGAYASIRSRSTGQCLDVRDFSKQPGGAVQQYPCHFGKNQLWKVEKHSSSSMLKVTFKSLHSGLCLAIRGNEKYGRGNFTKLIQQTCRGSLNQQFDMYHLYHGVDTSGQFHYIGEYPKDRRIRWGNKLQGVSHDANNWFIVQRYSLWKFPVSRPLSEHVPGQPGGKGGIYRAFIPHHLRGGEDDHLGDPDHFAGKLYVPFESGSGPRVLVYRGSDLHYLSHVRIKEERQIPWLAINPRDKHLYTSSFNHQNHGAQPVRLRKYQIRYSGKQLILTYKGYVQLRDRRGKVLKLKRLQGGCFSPKGEFFIVSDVKHGGIYYFNSSFRLRQHIPVNYKPGGVHAEELEGITFWDLDNGRAHRIRGQLHLTMLDNDVSLDEVYFKHYRVSYPPQKVQGLGHKGHGADLALTQLDSNNRPELFVMAYDAPSGSNKFMYRVGMNLDSRGRTLHWNGPYTVGGVGNEGGGAGMAIRNLDYNKRPDMVLMAYDEPSGGNSFRYKIGWNLDQKGKASRWSKAYHVPGVGNKGDGAAVAVHNIDQNARPELFVMAYDAPTGGNSFRYKIGWNLNTKGYTSQWSQAIHVPGVGYHGEGAGMALVNLDNNPRPDLVFMAYDNPEGGNTFHYKIGWNINAQGVTQSWSPVYSMPGVGASGDGAGIAFWNIDNNIRPELFFLGYDDPSGANSFYYRVMWNPDKNGRSSYGSRPVMPK